MDIDIIITNNLQHLRLDSLVCGHLKGCSRSRSAYLITTGQVLVNDRPKKPGYRVKNGDRIKGCLSAEPRQKDIVPERIALDVQYEDRHLIVINKAAGMVVHPAPGHTGGTLVNALIAYDSDIGTIGRDRTRAGIIHRLDKDTSGLMVAAKTDQALGFLQREFKRRRVQKQYLALVEGIPAADSGEIDLPIGRHPKKRKQMAVNHETGKPAHTGWTVLKRLEAASLVEVLIKTGRTHQIRVHFYAVGHPLIGDPVYQFRRNRRKKQTASRQMLHSFRLSFRHPYHGRRLEFKCDPPHDFTAVMKKL